MRYGKNHKEESRAKILKAVGTGFRQSGFSGIGVDGLAKTAGVTSGAFYGYFKSKDAAFKEAVIVGLADLEKGILAFREKHGADWTQAFARFYLSEKRTCELGEGCALPIFSPEMERAAPAVRRAYTESMSRVVNAVADGLAFSKPEERSRRAWAYLGLLAGGVTLARSLPDAELSATVAAGIVNAAIEAVAKKTA